MTDKGKILLRGSLKVRIGHAKGLPDRDSHVLVPHDISSWFGPSNGPSRNVSDPFTIVYIDDRQIIQTGVVQNNLNPVWNEEFQTEVSHEGSRLNFWLYDEDVVNKVNQKLGYGWIDLHDVALDRMIRREVPLETPYEDTSPILFVEIEYIPVVNHSGQYSLQDSYFPVRQSGDVVLYQDAHTLQLPAFTSIQAHGLPYTPRSCFSDMEQSLLKAKTFIYVTGWSLNHMTRLTRDPASSENTQKLPTIGELLVKKADEGVEVLVLVWNEPTSSNSYKGILGVHDETTNKFFKDTKVRCVLSSRQKEGRGWFESFFTRTLYSHHQKTIVVDDDDVAEGVTAYIGGLDLTTGRYDDQNHYLFKTLETSHFNDFHSPVVNSTVGEGPRLPWHDIHSRVTGFAAKDILQNFRERWLYDVNEELADYKTKARDNTESKWKVQVYRSISEDSAVFDDGRSSYLLAKHGRSYEASLHKGYVNAIRNADRFIYIESQFFMGSSHEWVQRLRDCKDWIVEHCSCSCCHAAPKADNLIPIEIARQICDKISDNERFAVYILIPFHPDGDPHSVHIQEMLYWQTATMEMMYTQVAAALKQHGRSAHPRDYLNFLCLGRRENPGDGVEKSEKNKFGRSMIYIHSKVMIVDDEYALVGTSNINQRGMDGRRDTEIAVGCWEAQPDDTPINCGHVQAFRKALWSEHFGGYEDDFAIPESLACVKKVIELGEKHWNSYTQDRIEEDIPHLLTYPIDISRDGHVTYSATCSGGHFPGTKAHILGRKSGILPSRLTL